MKRWWLLGVLGLSCIDFSTRVREACNAADDGGESTVCQCSAAGCCIRVTGPCDVTSDCCGSNVCTNGTCRAPASDAGVRDAGPKDAGVDAGFDAGLADAGDAGSTVNLDAGVDAGVLDAGPPAPVDVYWVESPAGESTLRIHRTVLGMGLTPATLLTDTDCKATDGGQVCAAAFAVSSSSTGSVGMALTKFPAATDTQTKTFVVRNDVAVARPTTLTRVQCGFSSGIPAVEVQREHLVMACGRWFTVDPLDGGGVTSRPMSDSTTWHFGLGCLEGECVVPNQYDGGLGFARYQYTRATFPGGYGDAVTPFFEEAGNSLQPLGRTAVGTTPTGLLLAWAGNKASGGVAIKFETYDGALSPITPTLDVPLFQNLGLACTSTHCIVAYEVGATAIGFRVASLDNLEQWSTENQAQCASCVIGDLRAVNGRFFLSTEPSSMPSTAASHVFELTPNGAAADLTVPSATGRFFRVAPHR